jgi:SAM-dependent methyltransferase
MDTQLPPPMVLYHLASAHYVSQALYVAAHLGIADLLAEGPRTHQTLAAETATHAPSLRRVLRLLASAGVFAERADGSFELTPVGSALRSGPGSFRATARLFGSPAIWQSWGDLLTTVRTGEPAFRRLFKVDSFEYFAAHPEEAAVFDEAMGSFTVMIAGAVAAAYDFSAMRAVIDVGGGNGSLLTGILRANPRLRGTVFDLPRLAEGAARQIAAARLADRCRFVSGDFFEAIPDGFDAYLLKHVIHDWDDASAIRILENCRRAMGPEGKLLIVEGVYPPRIDHSAESRGAAANDVNMLVCTGGRQRSEAEFRELYAAAGFHLTRIVPTTVASCVIEGTSSR